MLIEIFFLLTLTNIVFAKC